MDASAAMLLALPAAMPIEGRVEVVAPILNKRIEDFEAGRLKDGVQTFQEQLLVLIESAALSDRRWIMVDKVGVHPDNREKAGLVPVDVHDLLRRITANGWSSKEVDALACEIPPTEEGAAWRAFNTQLAANSDGLLAAVNPDDLEVVTGRGSHTTASVRCYRFGTKGFHEELCVDGVVSRAKIVDQQPSMAEPLDKGINYLVIRWQLVQACSRLMEVLSRTGNASHGVARQQTTIQGLKRVHMLAADRQRANVEVDWTAIARVASIGMDPRYIETASMLCEFARTWAGGVDGQILADLEAFERTLVVKRNVLATDLLAMSRINLLDAPRYVPAMVKALLSAPPNMVNNEGNATIFTSADYASLAEGGKNIPFAREAHKIMVAASSFLDAYTSLDVANRTKLISELEVRCVFHVHQKKTETRASFKSLLHIAASFKSQLHNVPKWQLVEGLEDASSKVGPSSQQGLREVDLSGEIGDDVLLGAGLVVGQAVENKKTKESYNVVGLQRDEVTLAMSGQSAAASEQARQLKVTRAELLSEWRRVAAVEEEARSRVRARRAVDILQSKKLIREQRCSLRYPFIHSLTHAFTHPLNHATHPLTQPLTHSSMH